MSRSALSLAVLFLVSGYAWADSMTCHGDLIEYTAFVSTIIPPSVAAADGIVRAGNRLITNVTVLRHHKSVDASVTGTVTNLLNRMWTLTFKPVRQAGTVYYLASQIASPRDTLNYALSVKPAGTSRPCKIHFMRDYYREGP